MTLRLILSSVLLIGSWAAAVGQDTLRVSGSADFSVTFRQSKWNLDPAFGDNSVVLDSIDRLFTTIRNDSIYRVRHVSFTGGASPEGSLKFNCFLSEKRAMALFDHISRYRRLADEDKTFLFIGRDWEGVLRLAELDGDVPYREATMALLRSIADEKRLTVKEPERSLERLKRLHDGKPYRYLYRNIFPAVRTSRLVIDYDHILARLLNESVAPHIDLILATAADADIAADYIPVLPVLHDDFCRPFYMDVRTNMLFDALALPNIGAEFYIGRDFSLGGDWVYGWWSDTARHRYWRAYGGELFGRWWFGSAARRKPLTGHHIGLYGQLYTYDFEWGGKGQMGGKPGGNLWDKAQWGLGLEYGYSLPVGRRINIDFSLGLGYTAGYYYEYKPVDTHYVWQSTSHRRWFGPTKAEISLVWLIGCDNYNRPEAGRKGVGRD